MPAFDFDTPVPRLGGDSMKWNRYRGRDVLPLWVADMDFVSPPAVLEALHRRVAEGVFGYGEPWPALPEAVCGQLEREFGWRVAPEWIVWLPGLVTGLNVACRAVGSAGDAVFTATPVYPPFLSAPRYSERTVVSAPLVRSGARWVWDFDSVARALTPATRLFMLCNPHNPVGRCFEREELAAIAELCERHDLVLCSDEIHCGLVLEERARHLPAAMLDERLARRCITLMAASKTYNLPGLGCAFAIISEPGLRQRFTAAMRGIVPHVNVLGMVATEAAYRGGEAWRQALIGYLRANAQRAAHALAAMPGLETTPVQASYLAWIDVRAAGIAEPAAFFETAGVGLSDGRDFGAPGFVRLNFGCARATLDEALRRMDAALRARG